jgi:hypothetical protein
MRSVRRLVAMVPLVLVTACGAPQGERDAASGVARRLLTAVQQQDGATACAQLAPATRRTLEQDAGKPCPEAIGEEELPEPGEVRSVDVYGQWARVVLTGDTVFLATFPEGWRVVAAGCEPQGDQPYGCRVEGD